MITSDAINLHQFVGRACLSFRLPAAEVMHQSSGANSKRQGFAPDNIVII